jgi:hypothetical protein
MNTKEIVRNLKEISRQPYNDDIDHFYWLSDEIKNVLDIINLTPEQTKKIEDYINERINNQNN